MKKIYVLLIIVFIIGFTAFSYFYKASYKTLKQAIIVENNYSPFMKQEIKKIYEYENEGFVIDTSEPQEFIYFYKEKEKWYNGLATLQCFEVDNSGITFDDLSKGKAIVDDYYKESAMGICYYKSKKSNRIYVKLDKNTSVDKNTCKNIIDSKESDFYTSCHKGHITAVSVIELKKGEKYWIEVKGEKYDFPYSTWKYSI